MKDAPILVFQGGGGAPRAAIIRAVLEGSGIACYMSNSGMGGAYPTTVGALGDFDVYVGPADVDRARDLLANVDQDVSDLAIDEDFEDFASDDEPEGPEPQDRGG